MYDFDALKDTLNSNVSTSVSSGIEDQLNKLIVWLVIPSIVLTVLIIVLYTVHMLRRRKIENAILEIRDTLREIKLTQVTPAKPWPEPDTSNVDTTTQEDSTKVQ